MLYITSLMFDIYCDSQQGFRCFDIFVCQYIPSALGRYLAGLLWLGMSKANTISHKRCKTDSHHQRTVIVGLHDE